MRVNTTIIMTVKICKFIQQIVTIRAKQLLYISTSSSFSSARTTRKISSNSTTDMEVEAATSICRLKVRGHRVILAQILSFLSTVANKKIMKMSS